MLISCEKGGGSHPPRELNGRVRKRRTKFEKLGVPCSATSRIQHSLDHKHLELQSQGRERESERVRLARRVETTL